MKKPVLTLIILGICSVFSYTPSGAGQLSKITIKMSTLAPKKSGIMNIIEEFRAQVRDKTDNEVDFKIYAGGVQGDDSDVLRKIRLGQLHGAFLTGFGLGQIAPQVRVREIPFMFRNREEVSYVRTKLEETMKAFFKDKGFEVLGWHDIGLVYIFSKEPIHSIEVLRKQKCWVWGDDPLISAAFKAIGISPIPLSITDVLTSLSTNLIDNAGNTPFGAVAFRWHTKFKYMTDLPAGNAVGGAVITSEIWDKISSDSQKKIKALARVYFDRLTEASIETDERSIEILKNAGIKITPFLNSERDFNYLIQMGKKAGESVIGKLYSRELLDQTRSLLDQYREAHPDSTYVRIK
jgi:TRAP-type C4-dicarboxylate transport system substrate-binding protein